MTWQDDVFVERLARLDQSHAHRARRMMASGGYAYEVARPWAPAIGQTASVIGAHLIGLISVPLLRFAMYHSQGLPDPASRPELVMIVDAIFAFCIAFFLVRVILSVSSRAHMIAQALGIWIALTGMHNLVHAYPQNWAKAFSPEWVQQVTQITEPGTLYLMGITFP